VLVVLCLLLGFKCGANALLALPALSALPVLLALPALLALAALLEEK
jgi:hypothetical protein